MTIQFFPPAAGSYAPASAALPYERAPAHPYRGRGVRAEDDDYFRDGGRRDASDDVSFAPRPTHGYGAGHSVSRPPTMPGSRDAGYRSASVTFQRTIETQTLRLRSHDVVERRAPPSRPHPPTSSARSPHDVPGPPSDTRGHRDARADRRGHELPSEQHQTTKNGGDNDFFDGADEKEPRRPHDVAAPPLRRAPPPTDEGAAEGAPRRPHDVEAIRLRRVPSPADARATEGTRSPRTRPHDFEAASPRRAPLAASARPAEGTRPPRTRPHDAAAASLRRAPLAASARPAEGTPSRPLAGSAHGLSRATSPADARATEGGTTLELGGKLAHEEAGIPQSLVAFVRDEDRRLDASIAAVEPHPRLNNPPDTGSTAATASDSPIAAKIRRDFEAATEAILDKFRTDMEAARRTIWLESTLAKRKGGDRLGVRVGADLTSGTGVHPGGTYHTPPPLPCPLPLGTPGPRPSLRPRPSPGASHLRGPQSPGRGFKNFHSALAILQSTFRSALERRGHQRRRTAATTIARWYWRGRIVRQIRRRVALAGIVWWLRRRVRYRRLRHRLASVRRRFHHEARDIVLSALAPPPARRARQPTKAAPATQGPTHGNFRDVLVGSSAASPGPSPALPEKRPRKRRRRRRRRQQGDSGKSPPPGNDTSGEGAADPSSDSDDTLTVHNHPFRDRGRFHPPSRRHARGRRRRR